MLCKCNLVGLTQKKFTFFAGYLDFRILLCLLFILDLIWFCSRICKLDVVFKSSQVFSQKAALSVITLYYSTLYKLIVAQYYNSLHSFFKFKLSYFFALRDMQKNSESFENGLKSTGSLIFQKLEPFFVKKSLLGILHWYMTFLHYMTLPEINSDCGDESVAEGSINELVQETGFPDSGTAKNQKLEEIVIIHDRSDRPL